jgi:AmmeMemoRadiSam system protein B
MTTRRTAVAGLFYPSEPDGLRAVLGAAFEDAVPPADHAPVPKALVVPHAGYVYSGSVAASAFLRLRPARDVIRRVVLLGPSHRVYVRGLAAPAADTFETPLGTIPIDQALRAAVAGLPGVVVDDEPHRQEHSLEVQLPFLQTVLDRFTLLPFSVGDSTTDQVAGVLDTLWGGAETLIVISTDLSHYEPYASARQIDARTAAAIVAEQPELIGDRDACGARPLRGLLRVAGERDLAVEQLDLRNSGDTAGDRRRVVGYGSFAVG